MGIWGWIGLLCAIFAAIIIGGILWAKNHGKNYGENLNTWWDEFWEDIQTYEIPEQEQDNPMINDKYTYVVIGGAQIISSTWKTQSEYLGHIGVSKSIGGGFRVGGGVPIKRTRTVLAKKIIAKGTVTVTDKKIYIAGDVPKSYTISGIFDINPTLIMSGQIKVPGWPGLVISHNRSQYSFNFPDKESFMAFYIAVLKAKEGSLPSDNIHNIKRRGNKVLNKVTPGVQSKQK